MDLVLYGRVLWRFRLVVALGLSLGLVLAVLSYYSVSFGGGKPTFKPRKAEVYQSQGTTLLTLGEDVNSPIVPSSAYGTLIGYSPYFARLANSDEVKRLMAKMNRRPLDGTANTVPAADTSYGNVTGIPGLTTFGTASTPGEAQRITSLAIRAFSSYFARQQNLAGVKPGQRVNLRLVSAPTPAVLIVPRKKTLPIVVFLAMAFATIALAFVLENARPGIRVMSADEPDGVAITGVRRSA